MNTINCIQLRTQFDDRLDGRLDEPQRESFDRHVAVCAACATEWRAYAASWDVLTRPEGIEPSFGFVERTMRRLEEQSEPIHAGWLLPVWRWAILGSAAAVMLVSGWMLWQRAETQHAGELYAAVNATDFVEDFDVIASLDLIQGQVRQ
jgi:anti-sigma factor RsiW